jgi:MFS family permease
VSTAAFRARLGARRSRSGREGEEGRGSSARFLPALSRDLWIYELGVGLDALGRGATTPFVLIYLHDVRGFSLALAGLVAASFAAAGFGGTFAGGALSDRVGPRATLIGSLLVTGGAYGWLAFVTRPWAAFAAMALSGLGFGAFRTSHSAALATLAEREGNSLAAFSVNRAMDNFGLGLGALAGGLIATTAAPSTFSAIFVVDAASSVAFALVVAIGLRAPIAAAAQRPEQPRASYRAVLGQRTLLALVGLNVLFVCAGYAVFQSALPIFAKAQAGVTERGIGLIFLVNTFAVVAFQLPALRAMQGRPRLRVLAVVGPIWAVSWLAVVAAGMWLTGTAALTALLGIAVLFAAGECALPVLTMLVAELAPPELRGRCLGLLPASYAVALSLGPALIGLGLSISPYLIWAVAIPLLLVAGAVALALQRTLPERLRRVRAAPAPQPA